MSKLNWASRQSPTDHDNIAPSEVDYSFDYTRGSKLGEPSWPEKHSGQKFGPAFIRNALASGLIVFAEIEGFPYPVMIKEARWCGQVLEVATLEGPRVAERLFTRPDAKGMTVSGLLIEEG